MTSSDPVTQTSPSPTPLEPFAVMKRRQFLTVALSTMAAIWSSMALYPIYRYLKPAKTTEDTVKITSLSLGPLANLPPGTSKNVQFGSTPVVVVHLPTGELKAFSAVCTHLGCTVQYRGDNNKIWCACHGGVYNATTGINEAGPPPKPLPPYNVAVVNDEIILTKA